MQTRCMAACVGHIRLQGLVQMNPDGTWKEDRQHPLYYLVHIAKIALPLYPQFGTEPNGYYIPPRWVPREYLRQMFGPGADAAVERYASPDRELLAVLQLFGKDARMCFRYEIKPGPKIFETTIRGRKFELFDDTIIGYAKDGSKIIETKVEEPLHVRGPQHANSI
jgi:nitrate reductase beta subunit